MKKKNNEETIVRMKKWWSIYKTAFYGWDFSLHDVDVIIHRHQKRKASFVYT